MAWNQPNSAAEGSGRSRRPVRPSSTNRARLYLWLAVAIVAALGTALWWLFRGDAHKVKPPSSPSLRPRPIATVTNPPVARSAAVPAPRARRKLTREEKLKEIRDRYGDNIPDYYKPVVYFLEHPPHKTFKAESTHPYLRHPSERQIAGVVLTEPGTYFVMKPEFNESFDRDFMTALIDKIEINDDDDDDVKAVKKATTEAKKEIAEICKKEGLRPSEVMNQQAAAMFELGRYQRDLEEELNKIHENPDYSDADVTDFCKAANEMLKAKGLNPMPIPNLARRGIQLRHAQIRAERKAAREAAENASQK